MGFPELHPNLWQGALHTAILHIQLQWGSLESMPRGWTSDVTVLLGIHMLDTSVLEVTLNR